jgi:hypothetical protein
MVTRRLLRGAHAAPTASVLSAYCGGPIVCAYCASCCDRAQGALRSVVTAFRLLGGALHSDAIAFRERQSLCGVVCVSPCGVAQLLGAAPLKRRVVSSDAQQL